MADAPATIGHDIDVPELAYSLQECVSSPSLRAEYICQHKCDEAESAWSWHMELAALEASLRCRSAYRCQEETTFTGRTILSPTL